VEGNLGSVGEEVLEPPLSVGTRNPLGEIRESGDGTLRVELLTACRQSERERETRQGRRTKEGRFTGVATP
jgi:hypothetical protein